ncbi:MAG: ABC transporter substrate-binding protein [Caldilineaceae bacterium]|jgi:multiple sugar transport system substrate-binding protein
MSKRAVLVAVAVLLLAALAASCTAPTAAPEAAEGGGEAAAPAVDELNILWAQWDPADYLQEMGNMYQEETGIKVNVVQEPWGSFYDRAFTEFAAGGDTFDMIVGDSQWLGQGSEQGHYVNLTDFMVENGMDTSVTPGTLVYYGEYPTGSGQYWAYPTEGDAVGFAYRKDYFENPDEMAAFEAEYGYPLAPPETWEQFMDIAKFFTRPDDGIWGAAVYTQKDYDGMTMGYENVLFSYGGDWKDPETNEVVGVANSPEAIAALEYYRELYDCCSPPGMGNAFFQETNDAMISGQAVMAMNYFAFFPALVSEAINPFAADMGFFAVPKGPGGESYAALGGQGTSIVSYISEERQQAAKDFLKWFASPEIQAEWAAIGGYTCNSDVLASEEFLQYAVYNEAFANTMNAVKDFWNIPVFGQLLEPTQRVLTAYVVGGEGTAQEALDTMVEEHDAILRENGYIE